MALAAPIEPLEHQAMHGMIKLTERTAVVGHSKVVEVTLQASRERSVLVLDRVVPVAPAILGDGLNRPS